MSGAPVRGPTIDLCDTFARAAGSLGAGWVTGHDLAPTLYEPVGIDGTGAAVITDPYARTGVDGYEPERAIEANPHPPADGKLYPGIGYAVRDLPGWLPDVEVVWAGNRSTVAGHHVEAGPLLYADPSNPLGGFGCWMASLYATSSNDGLNALLVGYIGSPPELFGQDDAPVIGAAAYAHTDGTPMRVRIRSIEPGVVSVYLDGRIVTINGEDTVTIDASLLGSTLHGFCLDAHMVRPRSSIPTIPGVLGCRFLGIA